MSRVVRTRSPVIILAAFCTFAKGWSTEELALYDLVEEVNADFYSFFSVEKDATLADIKKAYRRLSLEWHPDRNQAAGADEMFRKIASIYEVLKTPELREKYDNVLEFGLPDWRQPIYYFRRARKLSWSETVLVLLLICSAGHYLMLWGAYVDKYWTLSSTRSKLRKKEIRLLKRTGNVDAEEVHEAQIVQQLADVRPHFRHLLPFLIVSSLYQLALATPSFLRQCCEDFQSRNRIVEEKQEEPVRRFVPTSSQPTYQYAVASDVKPVSTNDPSMEKKLESELSESIFNDSKQGRKWSCEELAHLVKLSTEKYPAGTSNRWDHMARILSRSPDDVTAMVGKLKLMKKDEYAKLLRSAQSSSVVMKAASVTAIKPSEMTANEMGSAENGRVASFAAQTSVDNVVDEWSQHDQKLFEMALQQFPKGSADRWDKIVNCVPNKTKQQCLDRFKYLSEMVRQRKAQNRNKK